MNGRPAASIANRARRDRLIVLACVAAITIAAWAYLVHLDRQMSEAMAEHQAMADMGMPMTTSWTIVDAAFAFVMWTVMMAGMMTASATPMLLVVARSRGRSGQSAGAAGALTFAVGYLLV
jgi:predicted metal-binding membrane protein